MSGVSGKGGGSLVTTHFWVSSYPFCESTIFVIPPAALSQDLAQSLVTVYDADGNVANEVALEFPRSDVGMLELESLMGGCKLESGMKHGQAIVQSPPGYSHICRLHTREGAAILGEPTGLTADRSTFFPLTFDEGRSYVLVLINQSKVSAAVKARLFCSKRSPETLVSLPPLGTRAIHVETEFADYGGGEAGRQLQGYLRLSTKSEGKVGVQLIERHATKSDAGVFNAVG